MTKVCIVKGMVFLMATYSCESWVLKKAECQRIDAFKPWCWEFWGRSNQSVLREITLSTHWKDWYWSWCSSILVQPTHWKSPWGGKDWRQKRASEDEMFGWHHQCNGHELGKTLGDVERQEARWSCSPPGHKESHTWPGHWTTTENYKFCHMLWFHYLHVL